MKAKWVLALSLLAAFPLLARADGPGLEVPASGTPIPFVPFNISDIINPATNLPCTPTEIVRIAQGSNVMWEGPAQELLDKLNAAEEYYSKIGVSLRDQVAKSITEVVVAAPIFDKQFLASLGLLTSVLQGKARAPLTACEELDLGKLGINPETALPFDGNAMLPMQFGVRLTANQLLRRLGEQRRLLCQVGYDLLQGVPLSGAGALSALLQRRDSLLSNLGISKLHPLFDLTVLAEAEDYADILSNVEAAANGDLSSGVQAVQDLADKFGAELPPDWKIPDLPNIPAPDLPKRKDLEMLKRLEWKGFDEGDHGTAAIYANAWFEVRGDQKTKTLDARGQGKAGAYLLGNELNLVNVHGYFTAVGTEGTLNGNVTLSVVGQEIYKKDIAERAKYTDNNPKLWEKSIGPTFSQTFMAGPIPVTLTAGLKASLYVGYKVGLVPVSVSGELRPGAEASAFVEGSVGACSFLCAGAGGEVTIIDAGIPLRGKAGLNFDGQGLPTLDLNVGANFEYELLRGRFYVFAHYPVPFEIRRAEHVLFSWPGERGTMHIFNWGMTISPFGVKLRGDSVDANDREVAQNLEQSLTVQKRAEELAKYEQKVQEKERAVFTAIVKDLDSDATRRVSPELAPALDNQFATQRSEYLQRLGNSIAPN